MSLPNSDIIRYLLFRLRTDPTSQEQKDHRQVLFDGLKRELQSTLAIDLRPSSRSSWLRVKEYLDDEDVILLFRALTELDLPRLTHLDLSHNKIGERSGVALAESLRQVYLPALTHLDLSHNKIGEHSVIALAEVLERGYLSGLTWLDLSQNHSPNSSTSNGEKESSALARALMSGNLSNLQHLGLPPCNLDTVVSAFWEGRIKDLTHLHLTGYFTDAATANSVHLASQSIRELFQMVKHMPLEHIYLRRCGLTWDVMEEFTRALVSRSTDGHHDQCLQHLDLSENSLGVRGVVALGRVMKEGHLSNVTHLSLGSCSIDDIYQIRALEEGIRSGNMPNLTHLDISSNKLEFLGTCSLINMIEEDRLSNLLHLNVSNCSMRMAPGLESWRPGKPLRSRSYLDMDERDIFDFIASMKKGSLSKLRILDMSFNKLGTQGCAALVRVIQGGWLPDLVRLHLCGCGIKDNGILSLVEAIRGGHLEGLQYLDLGFNKFDNPGVEAVAGMLKEGFLPNLRFLNLYLIRVDRVPFSKEAVASTYDSIYGAAGEEAGRSLHRDKETLVRISFFWAQGKRRNRLERREAIVSQMVKSLIDAFMLNNKLTVTVVGFGEYDALFQDCRDRNLQMRGVQSVHNPPSRADVMSLASLTWVAYLTSFASLSFVVLSLGLCLYMV
ncbi:unnamed protein product [Calypogeia fissa]